MHRRHISLSPTLAFGRVSNVSFAHSNSGAISEDCFAGKISLAVGSVVRPSC